MKKQNILVTGGAGFIGSNLVYGLLKDERIEKIRVLDNLSTGHLENLSDVLDDPRLTFVEGDIRDYQTCLEACAGMDLVSHQAALGSVPRSIADPLTTNDVNITGTLNVFKAAVESKIKRVVFAASSSTYGDSKELPKVEHRIGKPLSPYAVSKFVNELYADVFANTYSNFEYIGLRYFNVFGPNQDPSGPYAAVIPLFIKAATVGHAPTINGDGLISRDFTYVDNAVDANLLALFVPANNGGLEVSAVNQVYNVACGKQTSLNDLWTLIKKYTQSSINPMYGPERIGDIRHSMANIEKARKLLGYEVRVDVEQGLEKLIKLKSLHR